MVDAVRYAIGDLADLGGVSRRTVRYYVQEGLLPQPFGLGRGHHYGPEHLERLLRVKSMQESGRTLDEIRAALDGRADTRAQRQGSRAETPLHRSAWRRIVVAPGVELHLSNAVRLPPEGRLQELAAWCREHFPEVHD
jgi:DNA-binding transcriptional MerR regulator